MHPKRLESRVLKGMTRASKDFNLLEPNDRILVAMSGGKDSYVLMWGLRKVAAMVPFEVEVVAYHLDQGQPGHDVTPMREHMEQLGVTFEIEYQDTYTRVVEKTEPGKIYCSLCSRFRRAILYKAANRHGCNKVALGHHRDDLIETVLLNLFFSGQLKTMPPKLISQDGQQQLIRPLCYVPEEELEELSEHHAYPILPCNLCGSLDTQRQWVKGLLSDLSERTPHLKGNILHALGNVQPSHLLDPKLNPLYTRGDALPVDDEEDEAGCGAPMPPRLGGALPIFPG